MAANRKPGSLPTNAEVTFVDLDLQRELRSLVMHDEEEESSQENQQQMLLLQEEQKKRFGTL
eukprot:CAMPEP_0201482000 /NCGR_PEP_ID=MMETSP0151_2-20130828/6256_1 /ASSEMBLY_ACC=CAM_ASM_000257 /TAXON_ID=200890 /ORGANISM="Paramoeba atlantica, Strain 621/1 / CCAP 1560/9" /LENGTH=61 /DNA_ID=CAMNT_0047864453 /DNA_START=70 /DNA_END=252 /DNA_ORIENTATION=+